jgi:hypothetical protein
MQTEFNIHEANTRLSQIIEQVEALGLVAPRSTHTNLNLIARIFKTSLHACDERLITHQHPGL